MGLNWVLIISVLILVKCLYSGYRKGLVRILYRFVSTILAFLVSLVLVIVLSEPIRSVLPFYGALENWAAQFVGSMETGNAIIDLALSRETLAEGIAQAVGTAVFNVLLFIVVFILIRMLLGMVYRVLEKLSELPVLGLANRAAGAFIGLLYGVFLTGILLSFCQAISGTAIGESAARCIESSQLLQTLSDRNVLWEAITMFLI